MDLHFLEQPETPRIDELVPGFGQVTPSSSEFLFAPNRHTFALGRYEFLAADSGIDWQFDAAWQRVDDGRTTRDFEGTERRFEENRSDLFGVTANASSGGDAITWIAGFDAYYDEVSSTRYEQNMATGARSVLNPRFPNGASIWQDGVYANLRWHLTDDHAFSGGLRYDDVHIEIPDGTTIQVSRFSGDTGWVFSVNDTVQIFANVGAGFRAPNIADLGTLGDRPGNRFNIPNTGLAAEGVVDGDVVQSVNAASSSLHGVEGGFDVSISGWIRLKAAINYTWGKQHLAGIVEPADRVPPL